MKGKQIMNGDRGKKHLQEVPESFQESSKRPRHQDFCANPPCSLGESSSMKNQELQEGYPIEADHARTDLPPMMNQEIQERHPVEADRAHILASQIDIMPLRWNERIALYFSPDILEEDTKWFVRHNYEVVRFDCLQWKSPEDFFTDVSQQLRFPEDFGQNLDVFNKCLKGIAHSEKQGTVLAFRNFETFYDRDKDFAWNMLNVIATNAYHYSSPNSYSLIALVQSSNPNLYFEPVGAPAVRWKSSEWLDKDSSMTEEIDLASRIGRQLLEHGPITLYRKPDILEETTKWFGQHNYEVVTFDCLQWKSPEEDFYTDVSKQLGFPDYFGRNLHAFDDCLGDTYFPEKQGIVLAFRNFETFYDRDKDFAWNVLDIIATKAYGFLHGPYRLIALVQSDDPELSFEPVGAHFVQWNSREWFNKARRL
jgi:RNAse (barnase) inhibitor barstar